MITQQKGRRVPLQLQEAVANEIDKLLTEGAHSASGESQQ